MEKNGWRTAVDFFHAVARRFHEERGLQTSGSLAYTTLLALVPLLTAALAVATAFPAFDDALAALQLFILENVLPDAPGVSAIPELFGLFSRNAGRLTAIGLAAFLVTGVMLMLTIDNALNRIFRVERRRALARCRPSCPAPPPAGPAARPPRVRRLARTGGGSPARAAPRRGRRPRRWTRAAGHRVPMRSASGQSQGRGTTACITRGPGR